MQQIPVLETERLILREWRQDDLASFADLMADERVARFVGGVMTRQEAWRYIASMIGHWVLRDFGQWAVARKSDGQLLGRVGLIYPESWPAIEVGWTLTRPYWGHGYATEAARASIDYGFKHTQVAKLVSLIDPDNRASQRVAERLGETKGERTSITFLGKTHAVDMWEIARDRWPTR